jgi:hypothetical protein
MFFAPMTVVRAKMSSQTELELKLESSCSTSHYQIGNPGRQDQYSKKKKKWPEQKHFLTTLDTRGFSTENDLFTLQ